MHNEQFAFFHVRTVKVGGQSPRSHVIRPFAQKWAFFYVLLTSKGENIAFPPPSPLCNVVPMFELPKENNKHPDFEWRD